MSVRKRLMVKIFKIFYSCLLCSKILYLLNSTVQAFMSLNFNNNVTNHFKVEKQSKYRSLLFKTTQQFSYKNSISTSLPTLLAKTRNSAYELLLLQEKKQLQVFWISPSTTVVSRSVLGWHKYRTAQSHYVKWTHNINSIAQSRK